MDRLKIHSGAAVTATERLQIVTLTCNVSQAELFEWITNELKIYSRHNNTICLPTAYALNGSYSSKIDF